MATNIEQIFRSFVVSKFREIQEQQFGGGKVGTQHNGEINSSEQVNHSDDTIASIGNLQNDPLVQKIEQVLSEVLGAEPQYKSDGREDAVRNKSGSTKRGLSEEVQDEIPRKKSKKDKKHKDKKKKKKRKKEKKEKKYKNQSKESKLNDQQKECEDIQSSRSKPENSSFVLSAEDDADIQSASTLKQGSSWIKEKSLYENLNLAMSNSHDAFSSDTSKLDTSEEDSTLLNIQQLSEVDLTNERELENEVYQPTHTAVNLCIEDGSLNSADAEGGDVCIVRGGLSSIKGMEQTKASSLLETTEKVSVPDNSPRSVAVELEDLEMSLESDTMEAKSLDSITESLHSESMKQSVTTSFEMTGCKFVNPPLEAIAEAKDSVTTLGFLAMVVGKDFEATSEFLNTAKVKASERSPRHAAITEMKDDLGHDSQRIVTAKDLQKTLQFESRAELKGLEATPESLHATSKKDYEPAVVIQEKPQQKDSTRITDVQKCVAAALDAETMTSMRELKETQASAIMTELKDSGKYPGPQQIVAVAKDFQRTPELEDVNRTSSVVYLSDAASEFERIEMRRLKAKSEGITQMENLNTVSEPHRMMSVKTLDRPQELEKFVVKDREDSKITKDSEAVIEVKIPESILRSETVPEISGIEATPKTTEIMKTQNLEDTKCVVVREMESDTVVTLKDMKNISDSLITVKSLENTSESQYIKEIKNVDILPSDAMTPRNYLETSQEPEGDREDRDTDAASESLHMIFTNYSEHSLELYTEPEFMMELKSSETVPESRCMVNANNLEALHPRELKESGESETIVGLNDLQNKLGPLHRHVKKLEAASESQGMPTETFEAMAKKKQIKTVSHFVTRLEEKASDTTGHMEKSLNDAKAVLPESEKLTEKEFKSTAENELFAESEGPILISKSLEEMDVIRSETTPKLGATAVIQALKETAEFTNMVDVGDPKQTLALKNSASVDLKDDSKFVNTIKHFESSSESHPEQNLEFLQHVKTKYARTSPEFLLSNELRNQEEKQKLEERTETRFIAAPESLYVSERALTIVPESHKINEMAGLEHGPESTYVSETNSENVLKSFYMIPVKDSKSASESKIIDAKDLEIDSEPTLQAGVEIAKVLPEHESEIVEITSDSSKKNEMLVESQHVSVLQESDATLRSEAFTFKNLEAHSKTVCVIDTESLEVPPQCEELEVVEKPEGAPRSLFALDMLAIKVAPTFVHVTENIEVKATKTIETDVDKTKASTKSVEETFEPICMMDVKDLEVSQKLKSNLDSLDKKEINNLHAESSHKADANGSEAFKNSEPVVGIHISEHMLTAAERKDSGTVLEPDAELVIKYPESVSESITISEREDCDTTQPVFMADVKDSEASSSFSDTREMDNLKTMLQFGKTSTPLYVLESRDSGDAIETLPKIETKGLRKALDYERVMEGKDPVATATHLSTPEVKLSESTFLSEVTECALEITESTTHLQQENTSVVKYLESTSEIEYGLETHRNKAAPESESMLKEKVLETVSEIACPGNMEKLEDIPKQGQETKDLESVSQFACTVDAKDLEGSLYEEVLDVSETTPKVSSIVEVTDLGTLSSMVAETIKDSEKTLKLQLPFQEKCSETAFESTLVPDLRDTNAEVEPVCLVEEKYPKHTAEMPCNVDVKNAKANLGFMDIIKLKDTEPAFETTTKYKSVGEVKDLQVAQVSTDKEEQMDFKGISKSVLNLERQDLERNSTSVLLSKENISEASPESPSIIHMKDSVPALECMSARNIEISEQNSKCVSMAEVKGDGIPQNSLEEQGSKEALKPVCTTAKDNFEANQQVTVVLKDSEKALEPVPVAKEKDLKVGEQVIVEAKDSEAVLQPVHIAKEKVLETTLHDSLKDQDSEATPKTSDIMKENDKSILKDKKSEKISSKSKDKSKSGKKAKKSRSKSPSKSKKRKKKSRSHSTSRRARSRSKNDSSSRKKHSTSHHKSRSKSADKKESKESSLRSRRRRSRTSDLPKSRSKSPDKRETSVRSRLRRSRSSDRHKSRSRSVDKRESVRRRRRLSRSSDNHKSRSRSVDRRETLIRSRRRRSRSSDRRKSRSRSIDKRETSVRTRRRRSLSSDRYKSRSKSLDRRESSVRTQRRQSRSSDHHKSRSRSVDDKRETSVRARRRRSRTPDTRKSRSRSADRREIPVRSRRRRSRSSDNRKSRSRSVDKRESSVRIRRRRSRSSDNRRSKSKSVDKRETSVRTRRRRSLSSDRKSRSKSVDKRETSVRAKRKCSRSSDRKSRSKSAENTETSARSKRRRSKSVDHKSSTKSAEKGESSKSRHRRSKSSDHRMSKSKSRSKSSERRKDKDSLDESRGKHSKYRSKSKSLEKAEGTESLEVSLCNLTKSPEKQKSKSRSRSKSIDKTGEKESLRRSRSKGSKSPELRSRRHRTVSRSRRNRSRSLVRKRASRSKSVHRSRTRSRTRSRSCSRRWRRTRSRSASRQRSLSRERRRRNRRNRSRSTDRRRRRSDSRDSYRISLRLRSRSRTPVRLRSTGRRRSTSKSPDHRRSRSSSRSPKRLTDLDKAQLLEIAKANAAAMCAKAGVPLLPSLMPVITPEKKEEKVTQKSAKETILELTEKCKKIAQSQEDDVIVNKPHVSDEEEEEHPFINHPFKLNEPKPIFFNLTTPTIKPAAPKTQVTLTKEFPVSSGSQHRKKEADSAYGEWVPVEKSKDENKDDVFPNPASLEPVDISSALNERQIAQKRLTENTFDLEAMCLLNRAQERIDAWAELNSIPGHFTGSTGAQVLSSEQLSNSGPQAWVKKKSVTANINAS
ncbi:protein SON isoform X2 [Elgaria multicarinata webbii]|uniref:protein SON isoform X2 n=1 Tax=Elgaria multicarinata webbii TaxID=159646 RepID=UPI002FCD4EE8